MQATSCSSLAATAGSHSSWFGSVVIVACRGSCWHGRWQGGCTEMPDAVLLPTVQQTCLSIPFAQV